MSLSSYSPDQAPISRGQQIMISCLIALSFFVLVLTALPKSDNQAPVVIPQAQADGYIEQGVPVRCSYRTQTCIVDVRAYDVHEN